MDVIKCPVCEGNGGREVGKEEDNTLRWMVCTGCNGYGRVENPGEPEELPEEAVPEAPQRRSKAPRSESDIWLEELLPQAYEETQKLLEQGPGAFRTLDVTFSPRMERLWFRTELRQDHHDLHSPKHLYTIVLHRLTPFGDPLGTEEEEDEWRRAAADYHGHDCPSAVLILDGGYEHTVGTKDDKFVVTRHGAGSSYALLHPRAWHAVRPFAVTYTLMVQGQQFDEKDREPDLGDYPSRLKPLTERAALSVWWNFCLLMDTEPPV